MVGADGGVTKRTPVRKTLMVLLRIGFLDAGHAIDDDEGGVDGP